MNRARLLKKNIPVLILALLGAGIIYFTGYHIRIYNGMHNRLISLGIISPANVDPEDFYTVDVEPEELERLALADLSGTPFSLQSFPEDKVLINFWASWCPPCIAEMDGLNALYEERNREVRFLMVTWDRDLDRARTFRDRKGYAFPIYRTTGTVPAALNTNAIPTTFIWNRTTGQLSRYDGMIDFKGAGIEALLSD